MKLTNIEIAYLFEISLQSVDKGEISEHQKNYLTKTSEEEIKKKIQKNKENFCEDCGFHWEKKFFLKGTGCMINDMPEIPCWCETAGNDDDDYMWK